MGLDMYFEAEKTNYKSYSAWGKEAGKADETNYPEDLVELGEYIYNTNFRSTTVTESYQIGYFRKFNALHNYICKHFADDIDECQKIYLSKEDIETMHTICEDIAKDYLKYKAADNELATIKEIGTIEEIGAKEKEVEELKSIATKTAETLLPTTEGFFFGSTEYDEWYFNDVLEAADLFKLILKDIDFDKWHVVYQASW